MAACLSGSFTKFVRMHALKTKTAEEVTEVLMDIFWDMGAPTILQSDNGREFKNVILLNYLNRYWSSSKLYMGNLEILKLKARWRVQTKTSRGTSRLYSMNGNQLAGLSI